MKTRLLLFTVVLGILAACQQAQIPSSVSGERPIDGLSRNVTQTQGGAIRDPGVPPPIRPEFVQDR